MREHGGLLLTVKTTRISTTVGGRISGKRDLTKTEKLFLGQTVSRCEHTDVLHTEDKIRLRFSELVVVSDAQLIFSVFIHH